jgi:hypothetical protein
MMQRDFLMRMVQELVDALLRAGALKRRKEYAAALQTIDDILSRLSGPDSGDLAFARLLDLSAQAGASAREHMTTIADLLSERGELLELQGRAPEAIPSHALALGLYLETMVTGHVSMEQLEKVERLISVVPPVAMAAPILQRLLGYYEARSMFARGEDLLFDWLERGEENSKAVITSFYDRLAARTDAELSAGDLPRAEVEEGRRALMARVS